MALFLFVTSWCSVAMDGRIKLVLAFRLLLTYSAQCCKDIQVATKIRVLHSGTLSKTPDFSRKFCFGILIVEMCHWHSSRKVSTSSVINWTVIVCVCHWPTKLIIPLISDSWPLQFITCDHQALSAARYSHAGQLATADCCREWLSSVFAVIVNCVAVGSQFISNFQTGQGRQLKQKWEKIYSMLLCLTISISTVMVLILLCCLFSMTEFEYRCNYYLVNPMIDIRDQQWLRLCLSV